MSTEIFNLTLTKQKSIFENVETYEYVDKRLLYGFLNTGMGISYRNSSRHEKLKIRYASEEIQMGNYLNLMTEDNKFETKHTLASHGWGRTNPQDHLSLNIFHRPTRHKFCENTYVDIDMVSAHPKIFLMFAEHHNIPCESLRAYLSDTSKYRNEVLMYHYGFDMDKPGLSVIDKAKYKGIAKTLPLILCYGGSYTTWVTDNDVPNPKKRYQFFVDLQKEVQVLMKAVYDANPDILNDLVKAKGNNEGLHKNMRTVFSTWAQTIERMILECVCTYLSNWYPLCDIVPCQDGFMLLKEHYYEGVVYDINAHVLETLGWDIEFDVKPFDQACDIPLHDKLNEKAKVVNDDETNFFCLPHYSYYELNQQKLDIDYESFEQSDVFIVQSGTGTGKSTLIANLFAEYQLNHKESKILCLSSLRSILSQLKTTFNDVGVPLEDYLTKDETIKLGEVDSTMCINSLLKLQGCEFHDTVLYIDEPVNLLMGLCNNHTIHNSLEIVSLFIDIIKNCRKVVFTDAHVIKTIEQLIDIRGTSVDDVYYYVNSYKKFEGTKAYHVTCKADLVEEAKKRVSDNIPFIFCSDSVKKTKGFYKLCHDEATEEQKKRFVLITAHTKVDLKSVDYNNSFVFMSPTVVCGLSIVNESSSDTLMYISGQSINPISMYQQCTRNRTMKSLYFYVPCKTRISKFRNYDECVKHIKNRVTRVKSLGDLNDDCVDVVHGNKQVLTGQLKEFCCYLDEFGAIQFANNFYFDLFCQKTYCENLMFQDIESTFKKELSDAGFDIDVISKEDIKFDFNAPVLEFMDEVKDDLIKTIEEKYSDKECSEIYIERCRKLKIRSKEDMERYSDLITSDRAYHHLFIFEQYLLPFDECMKSLGEMCLRKHLIDVESSSLMKVYLLKKFEHALQIKPLDLDNFSCKIPKASGPKSNIVKELKNRFRITKGDFNLSNLESCKRIYVALLRNVFGGLKFIDSCRVGSKKLRTRKTEHTINFHTLKLCTDVIFTKYKDETKSLDQFLYKWLLGRCGEPELTVITNKPIDPFEED